jgi:hypothetical protein
MNKQKKRKFWNKMIKNNNFLMVLKNKWKILSNLKEANPKKMFKKQKKIVFKKVTKKEQNQKA